MAIKHNTGSWDLKKYAKRVFLKASFAVFWAEKEIVGATDWVQNPLDGNLRHLFII